MSPIDPKAEPDEEDDDEEEELPDEPEPDEDDDHQGDPPADVHPFELDVDHEEIHIPPAIARHLADSPTPAIRLKSREAIADLERRGQPTEEIRRRLPAPAPKLSPWESAPREGFTARQQDRAEKVLGKEKAGQTTAGKVPGHTEQYHR